MTESKLPFTTEQLLAALGQAVIATDLDGRILYWNRAAEQLYGWDADEVLEHHINDVTVPQMSQEVATDIMRALGEGVSWSGGFPVQRRDGSVFPALVTDSGIYGDDGLAGVVGISTNLGSALRPLMERSSDAALVLTAEGTVTYASPAVDRLFGWQPEDLVGKSLTVFIDPRDHDELYRILDEPGSHVGHVIELRVQAAVGALTAEATLTDLRDDPEVRGVVCNLRHSERLARMRERERISQAAHADILQTLFGVMLDLDAAQAVATEAERRRLGAAADKITEAITALRRLLAPDADVDGVAPARVVD